MSEPTTLIPIAGGKGGIGKSMISANLGIALAQQGHSTIAVDLDLGGSNLHSYFGLPNRFPGIGDFLKVRNAQLAELLVDTEFPNLRFLPGDGRMPFMANITYHQKMQLLVSLKNLPARYVLLDLGAGTSFNTLDLFGSAAHGLVITTPEQPALMNMLGFIKNFLLRVLDRNLLNNPDAVQLLYRETNQPIHTTPMTIRDIKEKLGKLDPQIPQLIEDICNRYRPRVIMNQIASVHELKRLKKATEVLETHFSLTADHFAILVQAEEVRDSLDKDVPLLKYAPDSPIAQCFQTLATRITRRWDEQIEDSANRLIANTEQFLEKHPPISKQTSSRSTDSAPSPTSEPATKRSFWAGLFGS